MAEYGALLRLDLILAGTAVAPLAQVHGDEDSGDRDDEQRLDDRAADAAVSD
jgi:hypothetical protein